MSLSERDRRVLASIEEHLRRTDPRLVRRLTRWRPSPVLWLRRLPLVAKVLACGMALMIVGAATLAAPVAITGVIMVVAGLGLAVVEARRPLFGA